MSFQGFWVFIKKRMLVTYLTLIPSLLLAIFSLSFLSIGIFMVQVAIILIGTYVMFGEYQKERAREKLIEEEKFSKRLQVHLNALRDKIGNSAYAFSLLSASLRIAEDENIRKRTEAWSLHFRSFMNNFTEEADILVKKLEKGIGFHDAFENFKNLLSLHRDIKETFYKMIKETKQSKDFTQDSDFQKIYKRLYEEHNKYMDKLGIFSDECEAQFNLKLYIGSIEHLKDLNQL